MTRNNKSKGSNKGFKVQEFRRHILTTNRKSRVTQILVMVTIPIS